MRAVTISRISASAAAPTGALRMAHIGFTAMLRRAFVHFPALISGLASTGMPAALTVAISLSSASNPSPDQTPKQAGALSLCTRTCPGPTIEKFVVTVPPMTVSVYRAMISSFPMPFWRLATGRPRMAPAYSSQIARVSVPFAVMMMRSIPGGTSSDPVMGVIPSMVPDPQIPSIARPRSRMAPACTGRHAA